MFLWVCKSAGKFFIEVDYENAPATIFLNKDFVFQEKKCNFAQVYGIEVL